MQITFNPGEATTDELTALIALLASLGGRLPTAPSEPGTLTMTIDSSEIAAAVDELRQSERAPTPPPPLVGNDSTVDSKGTPWDARIHSESKATVADGTWRKRRGVSDELFNEVMAELTAANADYGDGRDEDEAPPPPPADEGNAQASSEDVPAPPAPTAEEPSDPAPAPNAPAAGDGQFADFPAFVGAVSKHGKTYAELNEMAAMLGVPMFKDMKDHPDQWDTFFAMIG